MSDSKYVNPFVNVHSKVQEFKDRAREAQEKDAEARVKRASDEATDLFEKNE